MGLIALTAISTCLFLAATFVSVFRKLASAGSSLPADDDWIDQISPQRYRPMTRLLDEREYERLRAHPAFSRKMLRRFRTRRVQAFRGYLTCLAADHNRVCIAVRSLMVDSAQDRADLAAILLRQRATFTLRLMLAEVRVSLHAMGVGTVEAGPLVAALEGMRLQLNSLMVVAQPAGA